MADWPIEMVLAWVAGTLFGWFARGVRGRYRVRRATGEPVGELHD